MWVALKLLDDVLGRYIDKGSIFVLFFLRKHLDIDSERFSINIHVFFWV